MAKLKKETIDELDLELLSALYYLKQATATDLEKELRGKITKAGISKRLKWLAEKGYLEEPEIDISTGKLRKVYKAPSKDKLKSVFLEWFETEVYNSVVYSLYSKREAQELRKELPPADAFEYERIELLSFKSAKELRKLREGVSLKEAIELLEGYFEIFSYDIAGLITVENGTVRLTDKGYKAVLKEWIPEIEEKLKELKEFDIAEYKKLLAKFCKDLS